MFVRFLQLVHLSGIIWVRAGPKGQSKAVDFYFCGSGTAVDMLCVYMHMWTMIFELNNLW